MPCPLSRLPDGPGKGEFRQSSLLDRKLTHSRAESVPKVSHCIAWTQTADRTGPFSVAGSPELLAPSSRERERALRNRQGWLEFCVPTAPSKHHSGAVGYQRHCDDSLLVSLGRRLTQPWSFDSRCAQSTPFLLALSAVRWMGSICVLGFMVTFFYYL